VWNYWLGGKDNYEIDRLVGDQIRAMTPQIVELARSSRAFLQRAIEQLAGPAGVRQFLDIGTGLPTADNTHQVAQRVAPESRVVYVDNDPMVLAHARVLLQGTPEGHTTYVDGDLYDVDAILAQARRSLDFERPVAVILMGILGHVADWDEARSIVRRLLDPMPPGSHLVVADSTNVIDGAALDAAARMWNESASLKVYLRSPEQLTQLFDGLELLEPGVVSCPIWRPAESAVGAALAVDEFGGVGRKP
jgi:O-methyltransferase involved in polyketide biosynthesis